MTVPNSFYFNPGQIPCAPYHPTNEEAPRPVSENALILEETLKNHQEMRRVEEFFVGFCLGLPKEAQTMFQKRILLMSATYQDLWSRAKNTVTDLRFQKQHSEKQQQTIARLEDEICTLTARNDVKGKTLQDLSHELHRREEEILSLKKQLKQAKRTTKKK